MKEVAIGIDIGGTNTVFGIVDKSGRIIAEDKMLTKNYINFEDYIFALSTLIKKNLSKLNENYGLQGIGIGAPNGNYYNGTIEHAVNLNWKGILPLAKMIKNNFDVPVFVTNDANAGALGEKLYGGAKNMNHFIFITLGTGLGSGIVTNGKLLYGCDGFAGEIGHTNAIPDGRLCGCGKKGCLETYVSATGIVKTAYQFLKETKEKSILRNIPEFSSKDIFDAAVKKDRIALQIFDYTSEILGKSLADSVAYLSPQAIFLFGGLANAGNLLLKPAKQYMEENLLEVYKNKVNILPSQLEGNSAAVLGASALVWDELS
ncbi:MAG: ROK family protein [Bacteroidales bacterium]|nr:ROK family protein [Bacteroidales bacterium]